MRLTMEVLLGNVPGTHTIANKTNHPKWVEKPH